MAKNNTAETPADEKVLARLGLLQRTTNDLTARIADHPKTSLAVRLARMGRNGIPDEKVQVALAAIREALDDAEAAYVRACQEEPAKKVKETITVPARVSLT